MKIEEEEKFCKYWFMDRSSSRSNGGGKIAPPQSVSETFIGDEDQEIAESWMKMIQLSIYLNLNQEFHRCTIYKISYFEWYQNQGILRAFIHPVMKVASLLYHLLTPFSK